MKVFISYHRKDVKQKNRIVDLLKVSNISYYEVPENHGFNGKSHQEIATFIASEIKKYDILICIVGSETYSRPHVDNELHFALKGDASTRKGILAVLLENRRDSKNNIDQSTFPTKLAENMKYIVIEQYASIADKLTSSIEQAVKNARNNKLQSNHGNKVLPLRSGKYYDMQ